MESPLYKPRPACWPQFGMRTLFLLVTIGSLVFGWFGVQVKWMHDRREARLADTTPRHYPGFAYAPWSLRLLGEQGKAICITGRATRRPPSGCGCFSPRRP